MFPFRRILVTTDFSASSLEAFPLAVAMATQFDAELLIVHVVPMDLPTPWDIPPYADFGLASLPVPEYEAQVRQEVGRRLELVAAKHAKGAKVRSLVGRGVAAAEISRFAAAEGADVIVLATHGWTGWRHLVFGSVAERVLRESPCPVLSVRCASR